MLQRKAGLGGGQLLSDLHVILPHKSSKYFPLPISSVTYRVDEHQCDRKESGAVAFGSFSAFVGIGSMMKSLASGTTPVFSAHGVSRNRVGSSNTDASAL
jgi:hypothetical protein